MFAFDDDDDDEADDHDDNDDADDDDEMMFDNSDDDDVEWWWRWLRWQIKADGTSIVGQTRAREALQAVGMDALLHCLDLPERLCRIHQSNTRARVGGHLNDDAT